ncbi:MAG: ankyrin repeat domain-containing protein [Actinomycetes bacterium]
MAPDRLSDEMLEYMSIERALRGGRLDQLPESITAVPGYPNVQERYTWTPLVILAISWAPVPCVRELVAAGADVNVHVDDGFPAILGAVMSGRPDRLEPVGALIEAGADLEVHGINGWTALHSAACADDSEIVALLLQSGADANARTGIDDDATPLEEARRAGAAASVALLEEASHERDH